MTQKLVTLIEGNIDGAKEIANALLLQGPLKALSAYDEVPSQIFLRRNPQDLYIVGRPRGSAPVSAQDFIRANDPEAKIILLDEEITFDELFVKMKEELGIT